MNDQFKAINDRLDKLQKSLDRIDQDLETDRADGQKLAIRMGAMEDTVNEMRKQIITMGNKVKDKVEDVVQPLQAQIKDVMSNKPSLLKRIFKMKGGK